MLPKTLRIHGYRSYVDAVLNFEDYGNVVAIVGQNGAGKSSIIEMLTTVLFNRNVCTDERGAGMDACINDDCDYFELELTFIMNDVEYRVTSRKRRDQSRELELMIDGVDHSEKVVETQRKIDEILRFSYDTFLDTVCIGQGMSARFMEKKPAERREVFAQILNLKRFESYEVAAKERRKSVKAEADEVEAQCKFIEADVVDVDELERMIVADVAAVDDGNVKLVKAEAELQRVLSEKSNYDELVNRTSAILNMRRGLQQRLTAAQSALTSAKAAVASAEQHVAAVNAENDQLPDINEVKKLLDAYKDSATSLGETINQLGVESGVLSEKLRASTAKLTRLKNFNDVVCSNCGSTVSPVDKAKHVAEAQAEVDDLSTSLAELNDKLAAVTFMRKSTIDKGKEQYAILQQLTSAETRLATAKTELQRLTEAVDYRLTSVNDLNAQVTENEAIAVDVPEKLTFNDGELRSTVNQLRAINQQLNSRIAVNRERVDRARVAAAKLAELNARRAVLKEELTDLTAVVTAFGKSGAQASIIARDLPEIEAEINTVVHAICDGELSVKFKTTADVGKGKGKHSIDTLDVLVVDGKRVGRYATYSGGERFRVDFACHVGLAKFLARRAGASIDFFIVDEGLGSQDDNARQRFVETLHRLKSFFKQIICITHIGDVQDAFDSKVLIEKDPLAGSAVVRVDNN